MKQQRFFFLFLLSLIYPFFAWSADFLVTDNYLWFDRADRTPVNVRVELTDLHLPDVVDVLSKKAPKLKYTISENKGKITISAKGIFHKDIVKLNNALEKMEALGARAANGGWPLKTQVRGLHGHDDFVANVSGVDIKTIHQIDAKLKELAGKPLIFRYYLDEKENTDPGFKAGMKKLAEHDVVVGYLPVKKSGRMPLVIAGPSIAFHARGYHGNNILGTFNPALLNHDIGLVSDWDKWVETKYWETYAPDIFPETHLLEDLLEGAPSAEFTNPTIEQLAPQIDHLVGKLDKMFPQPQGWVMKGTTESNTGFALLTNKIDFKKEVEDFLKSDFKAFEKQMADETAGMDEDEFFERLQKHKNYMGWKIMNYLREPDRAIVQKKEPIDREFRIEVISGKVLKGATVDRYAWNRKQNGEAVEETPPELIERLETWTQEQADKLPPEHRNLNWAFDVALLEDGRIVAIETNPGPCSGFLLWDEFPNSFKKLNAFLRDYYVQAKAKLINFRGLRVKDQVAYVRELFHLNGMDTMKRPNVYTINDDGLKLNFPRVTVDEKYEMPRTLGEHCTLFYKNLLQGFFSFAH